MGYMISRSNENPLAKYGFKLIENPLMSHIVGNNVWENGYSFYLDPEARNLLVVDVNYDKRQVWFHTSFVNNHWKDTDETFIIPMHADIAEYLDEKITRKLDELMGNK